MQGVLPYITRRLLWAPVVLFLVSLVTFALGRFGPGDPVRILQSQRLDPEVAESIRRERGLDKPFFEQYGRYVWNVFQGDLGESFNIYRGIPVKDIIFPKMWVSFQYSFVVLIITYFIGIPVGIFTALRQGTWLDPFVIGMFLFFASIPVLISVPILQWIFALKLGWLPSGGWAIREIGGVEIGILDKRIIMPIIALSLPGVAGLARIMRASTLEVLGEDYVRTARAKGLHEFTVTSRHVARNSLLPLVTIIGYELLALMGGGIITETLLGIPGIGRLAFDSITSRDFDILMALVLLGAVAFVVAMVIVDIAYTFVDPRVRYQRREVA
ncbi:MAG: ABC transporter permease [Dehalococcoidia bacterium]